LASYTLEAKARSYLRVVYSSIVSEYWTRVEVTDSGKHSTILQFGLIMAVKSFMVLSIGLPTHLKSHSIRPKIISK
jgi:hypothetical protein